MLTLQLRLTKDTECIRKHLNHHFGDSSAPRARNDLSRPSLLPQHQQALHEIVFSSHSRFNDT